MVSDMAARYKEPADYYVYIYHNPLTKEPLYVGKGRGRRAWDHQIKSHNEDLRSILKDLHTIGWLPDPEIVESGLSSKAAVAKETALIAKIGRACTGEGPLLNRCLSNGENSKRIPVEIDGVLYPSLASASRAFGFNDTKIASRLSIGWTLRQAAGLDAPPPPAPPPVPRKRPVTVFGKSFPTMTEACLHFKVDRHVVKGRLKLGWSMEEAFGTEVGAFKNRWTRSSSRVPKQHPTCAASQMSPPSASVFD